MCVGEGLTLCTVRSQEPVWFWTNDRRHVDSGTDLRVQKSTDFLDKVPRPRDGGKNSIFRGQRCGIVGEAAAHETSQPVGAGSAQLLHFPFSFLLMKKQWRMTQCSGPSSHVEGLGKAPGYQCLQNGAGTVHEKGQIWTPTLRHVRNLTPND